MPLSVLACRRRADPPRADAGAGVTAAADADAVTITPAPTRTSPIPPREPLSDPSAVMRESRTHDIRGARLAKVLRVCPLKVQARARAAIRLEDARHHVCSGTKEPPEAAIAEEIAAIDRSRCGDGDADGTGPYQPLTSDITTANASAKLDEIEAELALVTRPAVTP